jgi:hypothetical protein
VKSKSLIKYSLLQAELRFKVKSEEVVEWHMMAIPAKYHEPLIAHNNSSMPISSRGALALHE